ncbi:MAG TPA: flavocytochrome c, partial [Tissierellaceae bacterium]
MKKYLSMLLVLIMVLSGCGTNNTNAKFTAGTYTGESTGFGGDLQVEVVVSEDSIKEVKVVSHTETEGIGTKAIDQIPAAIVKSNSLEVDLITGATVTSKAIVNATKDALKEFLQNNSSEKIKDGKYIGKSTGYQGDLEVELEIKDGKIHNVEVLENVETIGIGTKAIERLPEIIVDNNSINVDVITGATATSKALFAAIEDALENGNIDASNFKNKVNIVKGEDMSIDSDVVIIGAGGAGITAAIEAKLQGAESVAVIEKMDITGGNTRMSGGEFAAPGNWVQLEEGIKNDSVESYFNDIYNGGGKLGNKKLIQVIAERSLPTANWLKDIVGIEFKDSQSWYGGHEVARTLWPKGDGPQYVDTLEKKARDLGVDFYLQTKAEELVQDETGRVTAVNATSRNGAKYTFNAKKGVIIASGGFGANVEMREKFNTMWPTLNESIPTTNSPAITGDGIEMGEKVGANLVGMEHIQLYPVNNPATGNYYYIDYARLNSTALLVNKEGNRFVNEKGTRDVISDATLNQTDSMVYELIDADVVKEQELYETYGAEIDKCLKTGVLAIGSLDEVANHFDIPADALKASIERYNSLVESGKDTDFDRTDNFNKIGEGPYFMFSSVVSVHHTMGGLEIDEYARVINKDGQVIKGLYAAGEVTG